MSILNVSNYIELFFISYYQVITDEKTVTIGVLLPLCDKSNDLNFGVKSGNAFS
jgi:hypothetical protein